MATKVWSPLTYVVAVRFITVEFPSSVWVGCTEVSIKAWALGEDGIPVFLDEDNEHPLTNRDTAEHWNFGAFVSRFSPVDLAASTDSNKNNKKR